MGPSRHEKHASKKPTDLKPTTKQGETTSNSKKSKSPL